MARVLIVEDDAVIGRGIADHLALAGFQPLVVDKGETGLARLRYEKPDVCVLDLMLPGLGGWERASSTPARWPNARRGRATRGSLHPS